MSPNRQNVRLLLISLNKNIQTKKLFKGIKLQLYKTLEKYFPTFLFPKNISSVQNNGRMQLLTKHSKGDFNVPI